jgi:hypothetical protein
VFDTDETTSKAEKTISIADQHKQAQMKSNIFGYGDQAPATGRNFSDKNRSNIFGVGDDEQTKRPTGGRHGLRGRFERTNLDGYRPSIAISQYSPLRLTGSTFQNETIQ